MQRKHWPKTYGDDEGIYLLCGVCVDMWMDRFVCLENGGELIDVQAV